jgi:hypothetical protein
MSKPPMKCQGAGKKGPPRPPLPRRAPRKKLGLRGLPLPPFCWPRAAPRPAPRPPPPYAAWISWLWFLLPRDMSGHSPSMWFLPQWLQITLRLTRVPAVAHRSSRILKRYSCIVCN